MTIRLSHRKRWGTRAHGHPCILATPILSERLLSTLKRGVPGHTPDLAGNSLSQLDIDSYSSALYLARVSTPAAIASTRDLFLERWSKYFPKAELPITFHYTDAPAHSKAASSSTHCFIAALGLVRRGKPLHFSRENMKCSGGRRYLGFSQELRPHFEYFLSCGLEGVVEGERYKKTPELVTEHMRHQKVHQAPAEYIVFERIDLITGDNPPLAVIFFATPDVLSGLFTLANYDYPTPDGVVAPFGSGCSSIVYWALQESKRESPRAVLGMFDISARPHIPADRITLAVPWRRFAEMVANMDESFLVTESWAKIKRGLATGK